jgi:hypothetical protein
MSTITIRERINARRLAKPERVPLADDTAVRNDVVARQDGVSERVLNKGDALGDPFLFIGKTKYRPERGHQEYLAGKIQVRNQRKSKRRQGGRAA